VIRCSPNPASGQVNILLSKIPEKPAKLVLYDRYGRILSTSYVRNNVKPLNLTKVSKGLYFVEVNVNNKKTIIPVAVQ
jgi:hypothetical protein